MKIVLATTSNSRRKGFDMLGLSHIAEASKVDESIAERKSAKNLVCYLAKLKAESVAKNHKDGIVIGFDNAGEFLNQILEKPKTKQDAVERLKLLSGRNFNLYSGMHMINTENSKVLSDVVETEVYMRTLTESEITNYVSNDPRVTEFALGFDPLETYASTFAKEIKGSYNSFTRGIALERVVEMLYEIGYPKL